MDDKLYKEFYQVWELMSTGRIYAARELLELLLGLDKKDQV